VVIKFTVQKKFFWHLLLDISYFHYRKNTTIDYSIPLYYIGIYPYHCTTVTVI